MKTYTISCAVKALIMVITCVTILQAEWVPDPFCPYPSDDPIRYPYYGNCSLYWLCYKGSKFLIECESGLQYNSVNKECDSPGSAKCDPYFSTTFNPNPPTHTTRRPTTSSEVPTVTTKKPTIVPTHSPTKLSTASPSSSRPTSEAPRTTPDESGFHCPITRDIVYFPYPGDCNKFWECYEGLTYLRNCPRELWWHEEISQCDYPGTYCRN